MASSTDFKKLFDRYQEEGVRNGLSIVKYCQMNGIVYSPFERGIKCYEVRDYLTHVFREIAKGNKDCSSYTPDAYLA